ncbi:MAG: hypothetical protein ACYCQI_05050, partial [Gammaproteobacteria bacterium]
MYENINYEQLDIFKVLIENGMPCGKGFCWQALIDLIVEHKRYDVLDVICARVDLLQDRSIINRLFSIAIEQNNLFVLEKIVPFLDKYYLSSYLKKALAENQTTKLFAIAEYRHFSTEEFESLINYAITHRNAELYQKILSREVNKYDTPGYMSADAFIQLIQINSKKSKAILDILYQSIKEWGNASQALKTILHSHLNHDQIRMTREDFMKHLMSLFDHFNAKNLFVFKILLKLNQLRLFSAPCLTVTQTAWLLKLCDDTNTNHEIRELLIEHRQFLLANPCSLSEDKSIPADFYIKNHFGEKPLEECIENLSQIAANNMAVDGLLQLCVGNKELEKKFARQLDVLYAQTNKTLLHFMAESKEENNSLICRIKRLMFWNMDQHRYLPLKDTNGMTAVDIACRNGDPKKVSALTSYGHCYEFDPEQRPNAIDYANQVFDPIARAECLSMLFYNVYAVKRQFYQKYIHNFGKDYYVTDRLVSEICLPYTENSDAQLAALGNLDELLLIDFEYTLQSINKINFVVIPNQKPVKEYSHSIQRQVPLKELIETANINLKKISLNINTWNLYLRAMYLLSKNQTDCVYEAFLLLKKIKDIHTNLLNDFVFAPFNSINLNLHALESMDVFKSFVEFNFTFTCSKSDVENFFEKLFTEVLAKKRFDVVEAMLKRQDNYFVNLFNTLENPETQQKFICILTSGQLSLDSIKSYIAAGGLRVRPDEFLECLFNRILQEERFDLLEVIFNRQDNYFYNLFKSDFNHKQLQTINHFIQQLQARKQYGPLLILYQRLHTLDKDRVNFGGDDVIRLILNKSSRSKDLTPYFSHPFFKSAVGPSLMADILNVAMINNDVPVIEYIRRARYLQQDEKLIPRTPLESHLGDINDLIRTLPRGDSWSIPDVMCAFYHSIGYPEREASLRDQILKFQQENLIYKLVADRSPQATQFLRHLLRYLLPDSQLAFLPDQKQGESPISLAAK